MTTIFDDLPFEMIGEDGGTIYYIRRVPHFLIRECATLTSAWHEILYLNVKDAANHTFLNGLSNDAQQLIRDACTLGYEFLALHPAIEPGNIVYRNERGEIHPVIADESRPMGVAISSEGGITLVSTGMIQGGLVVGGWLLLPSSGDEPST